MSERAPSRPRARYGVEACGFLPATIAMTQCVCVCVLFIKCVCVFSSHSCAVLWRKCDVGTAVVLHIFDVLLLYSFYVYACREAHVNW